MRFITSLLIALLLFGCASTRHYSYLSALGNQYAGMDTIWDGYRISQRNLGFFDAQGRITLLSTQVELPGFVRNAEGHWVSEARYPNLTASFYINYRLPTGVKVTLVKVTDRPEENLTTLIHEDFHGFQKQQFSERGGYHFEFAELGDFSLPMLTALTRTERSFLVEALLTDSTDSKWQYLQAYYALRWWRMSQMPQEFLDAEHNLERNEGTANWLEEKASVHLGLTSSHVDEIVDWLRINFEESPGDLSFRFLRLRSYGVGAALAELADQLNVPDWQKRVEQGEFLFDLFTDQIGMRPAELTLVAQEIVDSEVFQARLQQARQITWPESSELRVGRMIARHKFAVTLTLPAFHSEAGESKLNTVFSAHEMITLPRGRLFLPNVINYSFETDGIHGEIRNQDVMSDSSKVNETGLAEVTIFVNRGSISGSPLSVGSFSLPVNELRIPGLTISGEGVIQVQVREND